MVNIRTLNPVARAVGVIGAVSVLAVSVTFAALSSNSVVLADSQFSTGTAELKIWDGDSYENASQGFNFTNVALDTQTGAFTFWLKNTGTVPLTVSSLGTVGATPGVTNSSGVHFEIVNLTDVATVDADRTLAETVDLTPDSWGTLNPNEEKQYSIKLTVDSGAVSGQSASMSDLDVTFTGTNP